MSFLESLSKMFNSASHFVEKKVEHTVKHLADDVKRAEKAVHQTVHRIERKVEHAAKHVVKDTVHISKKAYEAFHHAEKKAEHAVKHVTHDVKKAEKAVHQAIHAVEKKVEQAVKRPEKTIHYAAHQVEKKAEHIAKQAVHGIMKAEQNVERTVHQVGKNVEKSLHEFSKHPIESTVEFVRGAGDAALADVTFNVVQRPYNSKHPVAYQAGQIAGHAVSTLAGMAETTGFAAVEAGGIVLDATGVGAVVGAPATAIAAVGVTHGATLTATGSANFAKSAKELYQRMSRSEGVSGGVPKGPGKTQDLKYKYWNKTTESNGKKVYQRDDLIDPKLTDKLGRTNLERMKQGLAPIGPDGKPINLHHTIQTNNGPIAEVTQTFHKKNHSIIHINPNTIPSGINRSEFDKWRKAYWEHRAKDLGE